MSSPTRAQLSRAAIVEAGVALADEHGLPNVSMRRVADAIGAGAMSLYNHVEDKDDLLAAMLEHVLAGRSPAGEDLARDDWRGRLRLVATDLLAVLRRHPWATELWNSAFPGLARTQYMEDVLVALRDGGFSPRLAHHGFHAFDLYVVGFAHQESTLTIGLADPEAAMRRFLDQTPEATYPRVVEHVLLHAEGALPDDDFTFLLDLLLDGLERHLDDA